MSTIFRLGKCLSTTLSAFIVMELEVVRLGTKMLVKMLYVLWKKFHYSLSVQREKA